jgi:hypothetical protein
MARLSYEDWVPEEDRKRFFRIEQTIGELENNPICQEASSTLFWQVFLGLKKGSATIEFMKNVQSIEPSPSKEALSAELREKYIGPAHAKLDRIFNVLLGLNREPMTNVREGGQDRLLSVAFTQLHLATALLTSISKISWGSPEVAENLISLGERAFKYISEHNELYAGSLLSERQALQFLAQAGYSVTHVAPNEMNTTTFTGLDKSPLQEQREESFSEVMSLFLNEQFKAHRKRGRNEEALSSFAMAVALWAGSTSSLEGELSLQAAVDCCEDIFLNKTAVRDWESVANACSLVMENLAEFPDSSNFVLQDVLDKPGRPWLAVSYWQRAITLAEMEKSPTQIKETFDLLNQSTHFNRLKNDFLEDFFNVLEPESLKALIQAERDWHESQPMGGRIEATANELRLVFERELTVLIFNRAREPVNQLLGNQESRKKLGIESKDTSRLSLREMAILLTDAGNNGSFTGLPIRELIERFPISRKDKDFLYVDLPRYLQDLNNVRRSGEHPSRSDAIQLRSRTRVVRRKALGIGEESYLVRLLTIKKAACRG